MKIFPFVVILIVFLLTPSVPVTFAGTQTSSPTTTSTIAKGGNPFTSGYFGNVTAGKTFTAVEAQWIQPEVTCQPALPGKQQLITMVQSNMHLTVGVQALCPKGAKLASLNPFAYFIPVDSTPTALPLKVKQGDMIFALIQIDPTNKVNATFRDLTSARSAYHVEVVPGAAATAQGFFIGISRGGFGLFATTFLAKPSAPIKFTACLVTVSGLPTPISKMPFLTQVTMFDAKNNVMARPSALSGSGTMFSVTWVRSG